MATPFSIETLSDDMAVLKLPDGRLVEIVRSLLPKEAFVGQQLWLSITSTEPLEAAPAAILNEILNPHDQEPA